MYCINCSSYRNGYCKMKHEDTSPTDTCMYADDNHYESDSKVCKNCESYESGWCRYQKIYVNENSYCKSFS